MREKKVLQKEQKKNEAVDSSMMKRNEYEEIV